MFFIKFLFKIIDIPIQANSKDPLLDNHYVYLKHITTDILKIESKDEILLNYQIYLLDRGQLPLSKITVKIILFEKKKNE